MVPLTLDIPWFEPFAACQVQVGHCDPVLILVSD